MDAKGIAKEAFAQAEKEAREKQVAVVKKIVEKTLEKLDETKKKIKDLREEEKILEMDIEDLKSGKIDQIVERQEKSEKAKNTSVVIIIKEKTVERPYNPWFWPYVVTWQTPAYNYLSINDTNLCNTAGGSGWSNAAYTTINCSVAKDATIGTYTIGGHTTYLR